MKKFLLILLVPLVVSAAAVAAPNPASATAHCKNLLRQAPLASTSLAACVTAQTTLAAQNATNAAKTCKAERAASPTTFATTYGTAGNGKSNGKAIGACVSVKENASTVAQQTAELNAAKQCKLWRSANATVFAAAHPTANGRTFAQFYGTNTNLKNAFGKCVSTQAKLQHS